VGCPLGDIPSWERAPPLSHGPEGRWRVWVGVLTRSSAQRTDPTPSLAPRSHLHHLVRLLLRGVRVEAHAAAAVPRRAAELALVLAAVRPVEHTGGGLGVCARRRC
jgi:hypothetical protein